MTCKDCDRQIVCRYYTQWANVEQIETDRCQYFKSTADVVPVVRVAEILSDAFGNDYPCNYNGIDEWLPPLCDYGNTCNCSSVMCWEQLIKHYDERRCSDE